MTKTRSSSLLGLLARIRRGAAAVAQAPNTSSASMPRASPSRGREVGNDDVASFHHRNVSREVLDPQDFVYENGAVLRHWASEHATMYIRAGARPGLEKPIQLSGAPGSRPVPRGRADVIVAAAFRTGCAAGLQGRHHAYWCIAATAHARCWHSLWRSVPSKKKDRARRARPVLI